MIVISCFKLLSGSRPFGWRPVAVFAGLAMLGPLPLMAAGIGANSGGALLGQPLNFTVQLRLQPGESLAAECVSAEVSVGDRALPAGQVRTALETTGADSMRIRVTTARAIDEPVVGVVLTAGCESARMTRRFVVLADPPVTAQPVVAAAAVAPVFAPAFAAAPPLAALPEPGAEAAPAAPPPQVRSALARADKSSPPPRRGAATALERRAQREAARAERRAQAAAPSRPSPRAAAREGAAARGDAPRRATRVAAAATVAPSPAVPRLKLDAAEPAPAGAPTPAASAVEHALQAVAEAASAARAAAATASQSAARMAELERTVQGLRGEVNSGRELAAELRSRLTQAEEASRWTWPLLALVLLLTAVAAWLAWRLNAAERARQKAWLALSSPVREAAAGPVSEQTPSKAPTAPIPFVTSEIGVPAPPARARATPAWPAPAPVDDAALLAPTTVAIAKPAAPDTVPETAMQRTDLLPPRSSIDETAPRDVSIEELIDLEQQAEFFVVLGQDEAAIDLLVEHLRHTGGGSPLPYLKLLEIYRRRGDRDDYERTRSRFNNRFNAYAPDWSVDLLAGRLLETYPGVIPRLQQVWSRPLDAMAELEALLFRKSRGELFDLPAYREVLFLYALARDLLDREAVDTGNVDLLLPLSDGGDFTTTAPAPFLAVEPAGRQAAADKPSLATVDFDLSADTARVTSIFGPLDELATERTGPR